MSKETIRDLIILLGIFGAIWAVLALLPWKCETPDVGLSIEQEQKLGKMLVEDWMLEEGGMALLKDSVVDSAVAVISQRLTDALPESGYDHHIWVVREEQINAMTLPGGYVLVNSGLIRFSDSPEEVAGVIAHELGHVEKRHVVSRMIGEFGLQILFSVITGGDAVILGELSRSLLSTFFSREQEEEADAYAWDLMCRSGSDPRVLATFFRKLEDEHPSGPDELEILSTHPHNEARVRATLEKALPDSFAAKPIEIDWERVKGRL